MTGTHFYLTLPSNASLDIFPDNKTTSYRVKLPRNIDLEGSWKVGLYSISYPNTWYTLQDIFDTHFYYTDRSGIPSTAYVSYGYYETVQDLIKATNKVLARDVNDNIKLTYNALTGKVTVQLKNGYEIILTGRLSIVFGFGGKEMVLKKTTQSPDVADMCLMSTIHVYCDIVEPQVVGDTNVQLLKTIPVESKFGDVIAKTFTNIQYVPIQTRSFENMEILLRNDTGDPVPFERGKVVNTLHFRQRSYFT